jgi:hypothetical protein
MKKTSLLLLILCCTINCIADNYLPLLQERPQWNILHALNTTVPDLDYKKTEILKLGTDTIIADKTYFKLFSTYNKEAADSIIIGFLREDIQTKCVYYMENNKKEKLLYDFNAQVGDVLYTYQCNPSISDSLPSVVTAIDSIKINGSSRKRLTLEITLHNEKESRFWIEGVGSEQGLIYCRYPGMTGTELYFLLCMYRNNELFYQPQWEMFHDCFIWEIGTNVPNINVDGFYINQNKSHTILSIMNKNAQTFNAYLFDIQGTKLYETTTTQPEVNINTGNYAKGMYILKVITGKGNQSIQKIIL